VHSAEDWDEVLLPEIERQQELGKEVVFRADAALAKTGNLLRAGETASEVCHPASGERQLVAGHRGAADAPGGRPSRKPVVWYKGFLYTKR
jgi:hypothetical protein